MEVIGRLAGGVAHDFNNILAVIMGYSELISDEWSPVTVREDLPMKFGSPPSAPPGLTRQLLVFSRKQTVQVVVLNINEVVKDMEKMLKRLIDANVELSWFPARRSATSGPTPAISDKY